MMSMHKLRLNKNKGFSLLELMIGVGILVVAVAGILAFYVACFNLTEGSRSLTVAMHDATKLMERIRVTNFSDIQTTDWAAWMVSEGGFDTLPNESIGVAFANSDPIQIDITVSWTDKGRIKTKTLTSLISQR